MTETQPKKPLLLVAVIFLCLSAAAACGRGREAKEFGVSGNWVYPRQVDVDPDAFFDAPVSDVVITPLDAFITAPRGNWESDLFQCSMMPEMLENTEGRGLEIFALKAPSIEEANRFYSEGCDSYSRYHTGMNYSGAGVNRYCASPAWDSGESLGDMFMGYVVRTGKWTTVTYIQKETVVLQVVERTSNKHEAGKRTNQILSDLAEGLVLATTMQEKERTVFEITHLGAFSRDLRGADLRGTDLRSAILRSADLQNADLRETDLRVAVLERADLRLADLTGADLASACLWDADLRGAILNQADLRHAELGSADLAGASLSGASYSRDTLWPMDFDPLEAGAVLR